MCLEVLTAGLSETGELWYSGKGSVQPEHFASALAIRRLNALLAAAPTPTHRGKILAACSSGEDHIYPLLLTTLLLLLRGWVVVCLGDNVPIEKLDSTIQTAKPGIVISTAQRLVSAASLFEAAIFLQQEQVPPAA